jgi:chemotaxis protein CheD
MPETDSGLLEVYLHPGESYLARQPAIIRTLLGSCVGVSFWSQRRGIGALTHCQLPRCPAILAASKNLLDGHRYVDFAIRDIARQFDELGARRSEMQVKVFGGADVLLISEEASAKPSVGKLNWQAALEVVQSEGFHMTASSLGGTIGRNIRFNTETGEVQLRWLG